jgi:hypothetical protein
MTSKPDPKGRDLGPLLAYAGLAVVVAAIIAGFIVTGGPGDARDWRLDNMTVNRVSNVALAARCVLDAEGDIPSSLAELKDTLDRRALTNPVGGACGAISSMLLEGGLEYSRKAKDRIQVCANFHRLYDPSDLHYNSHPYFRDDFYANMPAHPAGRHCFDIELTDARLKPQN